MLTYLFKTTIISLLIFSFIANTYGQNTVDDLKAQIEKSVVNIKQGKKNENLKSFKRFIQPFPKDIYIECSSLLSHENADVRDFAYHLLSLASKESKDLNYRKSVTSILLKGCKDNEEWLRKNNAERLQDYKFKEFSFPAKNKVVGILHMEETYAKHVYLMAGFLQLKDQSRHLKKLLSQTSLEDTIAVRNLRAALGRLGDGAQVDSLINLVRISGKNLPHDEFLFPLLVFTRSKKAIDYTFEEFNGTNNLLSARILDILAPVIKDFPIKVNESGYLNIDDYELAIKKVKDWYTATGGSYEILTDSF